MRDATPQTVFLKDYTPPEYLIDNVELHFDLDEQNTLVKSRLCMRRNPQSADQAASLTLTGEELELVSISIDDKQLAAEDFVITPEAMTIHQVPQDKAFVLSIENRINPKANTALEGLYLSSSMLCTQCEAQGFRKITWFLDRPDVMSRFKTTLTADKSQYPVLLSNGNKVGQGDLEHNRHWVSWEDPFAKPCYLFALVAGQLESVADSFTTMSGRNIALEIFVEQHNVDKCAHAMQSLKNAMRWDEDTYGLEYDLDLYMIVAVDHFNMGAMENKGLNVFNTKFVLARPDTATDSDYEHIEGVIGHEYFHNWSGNRITCRDWFQLSLKEGLTVFRDQEFSMDMAGSASASAVKRISDVRQLRQSQFPEDAGPMAHAVRPDAYQEINNFYTPTVYDKGAEVVRMMQTLVGRAGFARGMTQYVQRHDGQAVTCDDFAQAIADANPASPLAQHLPAFKRWYAQAGTPRLQARGVHDAAAATWTLTLRQSALPSPGQPEKQPFVIPVVLGLLARDGRALPLHLQGEDAPRGTQTLLVLSEAEQSFTFTGVDAPPVPSLLRGFSAPVMLDDELTDDDRLVLLAHDSDPFNRWEASQRLALQRLLAPLRAGEETLAPLDDACLQAMRALLRAPELDPAFKALALTPPSQRVLAEEVQPVDPQRIHAIAEQWLDQLALHLHDEWREAWERNQVREGYDPGPAQAGRRALANLALAMLIRWACRTGDPVWPGRAYQRVKDAGNMSDRMGALNALIGAGSDLAERALEHFHAGFRHEALALDKWFSAQALAPERPGSSTSRVLARARALLDHPDFSLRNPNRARSLVLTLCSGNPAALHRADASGYVFWAEQVLALDALNPQMGARLARALDRWATLAEPYRSAAREAIARVAARSELSPDTREIVTRALEAS